MSDAFRNVSAISKKGFLVLLMIMSNTMIWYYMIQITITDLIMSVKADEGYAALMWATHNLSIALALIAGLRFCSHSLDRWGLLEPRWEGRP